MTRSVRLFGAVELDIADQLDSAEAELFRRHDLAAALVLLGRPDTWETLPPHGGDRRGGVRPGRPVGRTLRR